MGVKTGNQSNLEIDAGGEDGDDDATGFMTGRVSTEFQSRRADAAMIKTLYSMGIAELPSAYSQEQMLRYKKSLRA